MDEYSVIRQHIYEFVFNEFDCVSRHEVASAIVIGDHKLVNQLQSLSVDSMELALFTSLSLDLTYSLERIELFQDFAKHVPADTTWNLFLQATKFDAPISQLFDLDSLSPLVLEKALFESFEVASYEALDVLLPLVPPTIAYFESAFNSDIYTAVQYYLNVPNLISVHAAMEYYRLATANHLFQSAAVLVPQECIDDRLVDRSGRDCGTLLHIHAKAMDWDLVFLLLNNGANYKLLNSQGKSFVTQLQRTTYMYQHFAQAPMISMVLFPGIPDLLPRDLVCLALEFLYGPALAFGLHQDSMLFYSKHTTMIT